MVKYKQVFQEMLEKNKQLFDSFKEIHDKYAKSPRIYQKEFNEKGQEVQAVIRRYENILCKHTESAGFGQYSSGLAEKFHKEIRHHFPQIDNIGLVPQPIFKIKKINLS